MPDARRPLYYTFGNHMHWVDMQWLWGYHVLPGSVSDMLRLIEQTGARGNVNFDAVGYEKMAAECPDALAQLRAAVEAGTVEPVGCSYGQPYGLFQGGESNVRQLTYGVRATRRHLGVRPRAFWEEEFYFFPQLPQLLAQCGYTGACLFFQWTWHTPEVPLEPHALILWEGADGTRLPTLPRNDLNVHQWPEDFDGLLDRAHEGTLPNPAIVQWLELMPSRDWMCRSEVLLPRLRELMADPRFDVRPRTVTRLIDELARDGQAPPVRRYAMDDVWHGMTLGKNAGSHPASSAAAHQRSTQAEALSALTGLFARPYPSWDVYPTWELDESWREQLAAQHHDNHECEGLCGFVGHVSFKRAIHLADEVAGRAAWLLARRAGASSTRQLLTNGAGWSRRLAAFALGSGKAPVMLEVPPFGYAMATSAARPRRRKAAMRRRAGAAVWICGRIECRIDVRTGSLRCATKGSTHALTFEPPVMRRSRRPVKWRKVDCKPISDPSGAGFMIRWRSGDCQVSLYAWAAPEVDAIDLRYSLDHSKDPGALIQPDPGFAGALQVAIRPSWSRLELLADTPYSIEPVCGGGEVRRKYPSGDWMTAPQWFESVTGSICSASLLDFTDADAPAGVLVAHDAPMQWFKGPQEARAVLTAYDPWDEARYTPCAQPGTLRVIPHRALSNAERVRLASNMQPPRQAGVLQEESIPVGGGTASGVKKDIPSSFGALEVCDAPGVLAHAFFRESMKSGEHLPDWAGHRMLAESAGACDHPYVIRLVEWNGEPAEVLLKLPGPVAMAAKTTVLGEVRDGPAAASGWSWADTGWLDVQHPVAPPAWAKRARVKGAPVTWSAVRFRMRPREIATVYADLVMGRKQWRDLDAKRKVWATVHRT